MSVVYPKDIQPLALCVEEYAEINIIEEHRILRSMFNSLIISNSILYNQQDLDEVFERVRFESKLRHSKILRFCGFSITMDSYQIFRDFVEDYKPMNFDRILSKSNEKKLKYTKQIVSLFYDLVKHGITFAPESPQQMCSCLFLDLDKSILIADAKFIKNYPNNPSICQDSTACLLMFVNNIWEDQSFFPQKLREYFSKQFFEMNEFENFVNFFISVNMNSFRYKDDSDDHNSCDGNDSFSYDDIPPWLQYNPNRIINQNVPAPIPIPIMHQRISSSSSSSKMSSSSSEDQKLYLGHSRSSSDTDSSLRSSDDDDNALFPIPIERFQCLFEIGNKGNGMMKIMRSPYGTEYAVKELTNQDYILKFRNIYKNIERLHHPNLVRVCGFANNCIIYENVVNGTLESDIRDILRNRVRNAFTDTNKSICIVGIAFAMKYLHKKGILNLNLKPSNILFDANYYPKISGYEFSEIHPDLNPYYKAPELFKGGNSSEKCDIYSFGIILFELATGMPAFNISKKSIEYLKENGIHPPIPNFVSPLTKMLIERCRDQNPSERPTFEEVLTWISDMNFTLFPKTNTDVVYHYYNDMITYNNDD